MTLLETPTGFCTIRRSGHMRPKIRYESAADASMGLVQERDRCLQLGKPLGKIPVTYYPCEDCDGFHLTAHPKPLTPKG